MSEEFEIYSFGDKITFLWHRFVPGGTIEERFTLERAEKLADKLLSAIRKCKSNIEDLNQSND